MNPAHCTVLSTRPSAQEGPFLAALSAAGFQARSFPVLDIAFSDRTPEVLELLEQLQTGQFTWLIFSSANGVHGLQALSETPLSTSGAPLKIAAQGANTARAVEEIFSRSADFTPAIGVSEDMVGELVERLTPADKVLLVTAAGSRMVLKRGLEECGIPVRVLFSHRTVALEIPPARYAELGDGAGMIAAFFSPSAVTAFCQQAPAALLQKISFASIGRITSRAIEEHGLPVCLEASRPDASIFASELRAHCESL